MANSRREKDDNDDNDNGDDNDDVDDGNDEEHCVGLYQGVSKFKIVKMTSKRKKTRPDTQP